MHENTVSVATFHHAGEFLYCFFTQLKCDDVCLSLVLLMLSSVVTATMIDALHPFTRL